MVAGCAAEARTRPGRASRRSDHRAGCAFAAVGLAITALTATAVTEARSDLGRHPVLSGQLGALASALLAIAGLVGLLGLPSRREHLVTAGTLGPAALWTWWSFAHIRPAGPGLAALAGLICAAASALTLLTRGVRSARWLESFTGLALMGLSVAAVILVRDPEAPTRIAPVLLALTGGAGALFGTMREVGATHQRTEADLRALRRQHRVYIERTEGVMRDLRRGQMPYRSGPGTASGSTSGGHEPMRRRELQLAPTGEQGRSIDGLRGDA